MRLGSITKVFTGEMPAHLAAKNTVQLAQPLTRSWPELAARAKTDVSQIRLVDVSTHCGGLPREVSHPPPKSENDRYAPITVQAFTDWVSKEPLLFKPTSVHYSNFGFDLLAHGLSKAANQPYPPNDLLKWMKWHLDRFSDSDAETRLLDHSLYLMRDGLQSVTRMDESGHMDAMGLGWVAMMAKGDRPFILQKAGGLRGIFTYVAFAPTRGIAAFIAINQFDIVAGMAMAPVANDLISPLAPR